METPRKTYGSRPGDARPFSRSGRGGRAYILAFLGDGTVDDFFVANKGAIVDAFRKSGAAQEILDSRPIDEADGKICFMVYVHDGI